ncbi:DUF4244 domain-containing protein [Actinophytocola xanthii]|uniref:DUF4244 domain-containing protein n=1 Tax=Actinophytocola xanthii TaxID=1912961 RepID=A0A1Q8CNA7_9PSEU|nr:DUF4244 domain-containing protein [Actinophytocola xanthii]OLF15845.1 hypothetical protein BU204_19830 [Actinophytocola xanthii]
MFIRPHREFLSTDDGTVSIEYALAALAAAAFAVALLAVIQSDTVLEGLQGILERAFAAN